MSLQAAPVVTPAAMPASALEEKKEITSGAVEGSKPIVADAPLEDKLAATTLNDTKPTTEGTAASEEKSAEATPEPTIAPLAQLFLELPSIIAETQYTEMWGVTLTNSQDVPTSIVLEKFLRANKKNVAAAKKQLVAALNWRKEVQPGLLADEEFDAGKFGGLGYVTVYPKTETHEKEIVTWNIYGAVKDIKNTFGDLKEFIKWRAALMELSLKELDLASATVPIPADGEDQYRMIQVHDYNSISFLRMDPAVKAASKETIQIFSLAYPELLKEKFFVNVPVLMGWVFAAMKIFLAPETVKKFHPLSYGSALAGELKSFGTELPTSYGGKGADIVDGVTVKYAVPAVVDTPVEEPKTVPGEEVAPVETKKE